MGLASLILATWSLCGGAVIAVLNVVKWMVRTYEPPHPATTPAPASSAAAAPVMWPRPLAAERAAPVA